MASTPLLNDYSPCRSGLQRHWGTHRAAPSSLSRTHPQSDGSRTRFVVDLPAEPARAGLASERQSSE